MVGPNPYTAPWLGQSLAGITDVSGDGTGGIVAAAPFDDESQADVGSIQIFSGADCSLVRRCFDPEGVSGDSLGFGPSGTPGGLAVVHDVDGDGRSDVLVGAPYRDTGASSAGEAVLLPPQAVRS